jgi:L-iditol 2-dehydrogenase
LIVARLYGKEDLRVEDIPQPEVGSGDVLVRIRAGQVCGTDLRMFLSGHKNITPETPLVLGHEISGTIQEAGSEVTQYRPGMRVAVAPNFGCGVCSMCVSGNTHLCTNSRALGITLDGGFAEVLRVPEAAVNQGNVVEIPDQVSYQDASLAEPMSCVYNAFERLDPRPGDVVLILGAGPIGLMHAKLYLFAGAGLVAVNDINPERLAECQKLEPGICAMASAQLKEQILEMTKGKGADICITACPSPEAQKSALELVGMNGKVMFFGGLPSHRAEVPLNTNLIHYKQITVSGTTRQRLSQYRRILGLLAQERISLAGLITSSVTLKNIHVAFKNAAQGRGLKNGILVGS